MILDEAIKHCEEKAGELRCDAEIYKYIGVMQERIDKCENCAKEHEQLAEWLKELKDLRESLAIIRNIERLTKNE